jgi:hypothetical protein
VVLTAAATVLAMVPLTRSIFWGPMAIAIMGGLTVATLLTIFFVPALYAAWFRVSGFGRGRAAASAGPQPQLRYRNERDLFIAARTNGRALVLAGLLAGCATTHALMPTPVTYTGPTRSRCSPMRRRSSPATLDLLFLTDRAPGDGGSLNYTAERSRSIAFGSTTVDFAEGCRLRSTTELGRFPPIPYPLVATPDGMRRSPAVVKRTRRRSSSCRTRSRGASPSRSARKSFCSCTAIASTFEDAALTMGEMCHFLGREFVCASSPGRPAATAAPSSATTSIGESAEYAVEDSSS